MKLSNMGKLKNTLIIFITIFLLACEKDEDDNKMSKFLDYHYLYASHSITTNMADEIVESVFDTTIYYFSENDTVIAVKKVFESVEGVYKYDTIIRPFYINDNIIKFDRSGDYQGHDFLLAYNWEVVLILDTHLKIDLIGPYGYSSSKQLLCISK